MTIKKFWNVAAQSESTAELDIYGDIGDDSFLGMDLSPVSSQRIHAELKALGNVQKIHVHINSYGGEVFSAQAIYSMLKSYGAEVIVHVDGIAASSASLIAMAGNRIIIPENALMMIHNPSSRVVGQSGDMRKCADTLDKIRETMVAAYSRCKKTKDEIIAMLDAETWMTGADAVKEGFADATEPAITITAKASEDKLFFAAAGHEFSCEKARYKSVPGIFVPAAKAEEGNKKMTLEELKAQHPDLVQAIQQAAESTAQAAERARIRAIDDFGAVAQTEEGVKAKYTEPVSAEAFAVSVLKASAKKGVDILSNIKADAEGLPLVPTGDPGGSGTAEAANIEAAMSAGMMEGK